jgi:polysaccharide chain length determinant protein (PEP-CTERM system associated)
VFDQSPTSLLKPEVIIEMVLRRRWWIIIPVVLSLVIGITLSITLPKEYSAFTTILVEPQSVPQNFVKSIVTEGIERRIQTISQQILSRTNLEKIVKEFNLLSDYSPDSPGMEGAVNSLSSRISIHVGRTKGNAANHFSISFRSENPELARDIPNRLASSFIEENLRIREDHALGTSNFLDDELEEMKKRLEEKEYALREYRFAHMGSLPDQLNTNLRSLDRLQMQLSDKEKSIREMRDELQIAMSLSAGGGTVGTENSLPAMEEQLRQLRLKYTPKHPDVIRLEKQIEELKVQLDDPNSAINQSPASRSSARPYNPRVVNLQQEIRFAENDIAQIRAQIEEYERRVDETPRHEQELITIQRNYRNIQSTYNSLLNRKLEAEIAVNMERKQKGEQFKVLDPARTPTLPSSPDMIKLFVMVLAAGLGIGGGLVFLMEVITPTFRLPEDIDTHLDLPVLATIPVITDDRSLLLDRMNLIGTIAALVVVLVMLAAFYSFSIGGVEPFFIASRLP